jgi:hypothetical protein
MYLDMINGHMRFLRKYIWKIKVLDKMRISIWFLHQKVILNMDDIEKLNLNHCMECYFCDHNELLKIY